ncbi:MAG: type II toxin-antitoxin system VapC family toxin [Acidobacteria bacterium]|nr:type II toxin-antitoxin system VapC family toxin [Acidobacteriota bacterium]
MGVKKIYLDSCIAIYVVEAHPHYATKVAAELNTLQAAQICYSPLVRLECLVKPLQAQNQPLQNLYDQFWASQQNLSLVDDIFIRAAQIRADFPSLKTPDAIHLATALHYGCDEFWTHDDRLAKVAPTIAKNILTT